MLNGVHGGAEVFHAEEDVGTGLDGKEAGLGHRVLPGDGAHLHSVRDNYPVKTKLPTELLREDGVAQGGGNLASGNLGKGYVRGHNHTCTGGYSSPERDHLARAQLFPALAAHGIAVMCIGRGVPVPREMFEAAQDALRLESLEVRSHKIRSLGRIVRKGPGADYDIPGIGIDIGHWSEIDVNPIAAEVLADGAGRILHRALSLGRKVRHTLVPGKAESLVVGDACHPAAFLVYADEGLSRKGFQGVNKHRKLLRVLDVVGEKDDSAHRILRGRCAHSVRDRDQPVGHQVVVTHPGEGGVQCLRAHPEHTAHLLPEGHPLQRVRRRHCGFL